MPVINTSAAASARGFGFGSYISSAGVQSLYVASMVAGVTQSFIIPDGVTSVTVEAIGPGGWGGSTQAGGGVAGGGGAYAKSVVTVTPGSTFYLYSGDSSNYTGPNADAWGSTTGFAPTSITEGALAKRAAGAGGGQAASSIGQVKYSGGNGSAASGGAARAPAGGGGAAGPDGPGKNGYSGGGGAGGISSTNGTAGTANTGGDGGMGPLGTGKGIGAKNSPQTAATPGDAGTGAGGGGAGLSVSASPIPTYTSGGAGSTYSVWGGNYGPGGGGGSPWQADGANYWYDFWYGDAGPAGAFGAGSGSWTAGWPSAGSFPGAPGLVVVSFTPVTSTNWIALQNAWGDHTSQEWPMSTHSPIIASAISGVDNSGNIYVTGIINASTPSNIKSPYIQKYSNTGVFQWQRVLKLASNASAMYSNDPYIYGKTDTSGNTYIAYKNATTDVISVAKYDSSGAIQWQKNIVGISGYVKTAAIDASGNFWVAITQSVYDAGNDVNNDYINLCKFTSAGILTSYVNNTIIGQYYNANITDIDLQFDTTNNIYISYNTSNIDLGTLAAYIQKYNSTLSSLTWSRGVYNAGTQGIQINSTGDVFWQFAQPSINTISAVKINSSGTTQWQYNQITYASAASSFGYRPNIKLALDVNSNVYLGIGVSYYGNITTLTKLNSSGTIQYKKYVSGLAKSYSMVYSSPLVVSGSNLLLSSCSGYNELMALPITGLTAGNYSPIVIQDSNDAVDTTVSTQIAGSNLAWTTTSATTTTGTSTDSAGVFTSALRVHLSA